MYYDFFGFREPPFSIAPDPRYLYLSDRHKEALAHLMYGVQGQGGFIVITGEVGTGKTTVSRCFLENAPDNVDIALILNPRLSARELLSAICDELEIPHDSGATIKELVDLINQDLLRAHAAGRHKVLLIDEAQNLSADVLEQLRLLTNLETAEKKLLQIVLLGQPELQQILAMPELRQLNQRVTARYHLDAIGKDELQAYLRYRLGVAGVRGEIFTAGACKRLFRESEGIPRLINLISDRALLGAYSEGEHQVTRAHIVQAAREVRGDMRSPAAGKGRAFLQGLNTVGQAGRPLMLLGLAIVLAILATAGLPGRNYSETDAIPTAEDPEVQTGVIDREAVSTPAAADVVLPAQPELQSALPDFEFQTQSMEEIPAFQALFRVWNRDYSPEKYPDPCAASKETGLGCLARQGSRRSLEFLNRPAILRLTDGTGQERHVVIRHLQGDRAVIVLEKGDTEVSFSSIEPYWFGGFQVLWRLPEYLTDDKFYEGSAGRQLWIAARMMELADKLGGSDSQRERIKRMAESEQVRWYQELRGLTVDGIAGAMTVIQIRNDLESSDPRLLPPSSPERG